MGIRVSLTQQVLQTALVWCTIRISCIVRQAMRDVLGGHMLQQERRSEGSGKAWETLMAGLNKERDCSCSTRSHRA